MVTVFVESLVREPPVPIISSEPFSTVKVPVVSVNGISSVTITAPSMVIVSKPSGSTPSLQFDGSDHTPLDPPTQVTGGLNIKLFENLKTKASLTPPKVSSNAPDVVGKPEKLVSPVT